MTTATDDAKKLQKGLKDADERATGQALRAAKEIAQGELDAMKEMMDYADGNGGLKVQESRFRRNYVLQYKRMMAIGKPFIEGAFDVPSLMAAMDEWEAVSQPSAPAPAPPPPPAASQRQAQPDSPPSPAPADDGGGSKNSSSSASADDGGNPDRSHPAWMDSEPDSNRRTRRSPKEWLKDHSFYRTNSAATTAA